MRSTVAICRAGEPTSRMTTSIVERCGRQVKWPSTASGLAILVSLADQQGRCAKRCFIFSPPVVTQALAIR